MGRLVRTTALARYELRELIWICGNHYIYCDTDSVYYWGDIDFTDYNNKHRERSIKNRAYAEDPDGIIHYMGIVEEDIKNGPYQEFKTLGAKKYAYRDNKGKLHITISGVVKNDGAVELEAAGGLKAFAGGFVFKDAGGVDVFYQDEAPGLLELDGRMLYVGTGAVLMNSEYTVSVGDERGYYIKLLQSLAENDVMDIFYRVTTGQKIDNSL